MSVHLSTKTIVTEEIDPKTGHIIRRTVITPLVGTRRSGVKAKRQEMIDEITALVRDLEIGYYFGNTVIECLKNYKYNPNAKRRKKKYFIPDELGIVNRYYNKYGDKYVPEVLAKEIEVLEKVLNRIEEFELDQHWKSKLSERCETLTNVKKSRDRERKKHEQRDKRES